MLTVRAAVWSANYPRQALARYTGRIVIVSSLAVALGRGAGRVDARARGRVDSRWLYGGRRCRRACWRRGCTARRACGANSRCWPRRTRRWAAAEPFSLGMLFEILRKDPHFREYMFWMGLYRRRQPDAHLAARGDLQRSPAPGGRPADRAALGGAAGVLPLFVPFWARMFDDGHIVEYRVAPGLGAGRPRWRC